MRESSVCEREREQVSERDAVVVEKERNQVMRKETMAVFVGNADQYMNSDDQANVSGLDLACV